MTPDTYTAEEFAECFWRRGYGKKRQAVKWLEDNGVTTPTEDDFERCYRDVQAEMILPRNRRYIAMRCDGVNYSEPQHQPNSDGSSWAAVMRRELAATARLDATIRRRKEETIEYNEAHQ